MASIGIDQARNSVVPDLDGTETMEATYTSHRFRPHFHETFLIGVTESGAELFEARGARHVSTQLSLRFFNPGEVHTGAPPPGGHWTYRCLYPSASLIEELARELGPAGGGTTWFPEMITPDPNLAHALLWTFASLAGLGTGLDATTRFANVLGDILVRHAGNGLRPARVERDSKTIRRAQAFIADHASRTFGLKELSAAVGLSRFHLARAFKAQVGLSPFAYQAQIRVERAKSLLRQGAAVQATATACGFYDRSHLSRVFRSFVGVAPRAYRDVFAPSRRLA